MPSTLDPESETVPQVTLALETLFKKLDDGLKINEESIRLVTGLIRALGTKFDATEALYREAPSPEPKLALLYRNTRGFIFDKLKTIAEKSADASTKGQILSGQALTLCGVANEYQREVSGFVTSMRGVAYGAHHDANTAANTFRTLCAKAIILKEQCRTSLKNTSIGLSHDHAILSSLENLLDVLTMENLGGSRVHWTKQAVLDRLVLWWQDMRIGIGEIIASLNYIPVGTVIRLKSIEATWRDLSNRYRQYTSQVYEALDNQEARKLCVTMWEENDTTDEGRNTSGTSGGEAASGPHDVATPTGQDPARPQGQHRKDHLVKSLFKRILR